MLSAVLGRLATHEVLLGASYGTHSTGFSYRAYLENSYKLGMFPESTKAKGYNFVPLDMLVRKKKSIFSSTSYQPCNLIEMAGEKIAGVLSKSQEERENSDSLNKLEWLNSKNHKIITIVVDITRKDLKQGDDLNQVFQLFRERGVLNLTKKVIILPTKVDQLDSFSPDGGPNLNAEIKEILKNNFGPLMTTIETFYDKPIVMCPFTVGSTVVRDAYIKGERPVKFLDYYISELRKSIPAKRLKTKVKR